jgi:non-homologous end joining protein Ku
VRRKAKGKPIEPPKEQEEPSNVINLMEALRQSVGQRKAKRAKRATKSKRAGRARKRKAA